MSTKQVSGLSRAQKKRLQMHDIAKMAGVSTSTVSRALSNSPLVNDETKRKVRELANQLNYTIDSGAQNLRMGTNKTIAVVIPLDRKNPQHVSDPFFLTMVGYLADELTRLGYYMLVSRIDTNNIDQLLEPYLTGRAAGIIVIGQWHHHEQLNQAIADKPIVVWGARMPSQNYVTIGSDNAHGGYVATEYLINKRGCNKIAFLGDKSLPEVYQRYEGYLAAHQDYGVRLSEHLCLAVPFSGETVNRDLAPYLAGELAIDGVFACSDVLAMRTIKTLQSAGIQVPNQVAVVGYDDISLSAHYHPAITTIHQSIETGAKTMVDTLFSLMNDIPVQSMQLPVELILRESA